MNLKGVNLIKQTWITLEDSRSNKIEYNTTHKTISKINLKNLLEVGNRV